MKALNIDRNNTIKEGASQLPTEQAYVCEILDAFETDYTTQSGYRVHRLDVHLDVIEGEYAGFYMTKHNNRTNEDDKWKGVVKINIPKEDGSEQDDWTIKSFNSNINAVEVSNPGYLFDWDEKKLIGKKVGLVLRKREYCFDGKVGFYSEPFKLISVDDARAGKFKEPRTKYLPEGTTSTSSDTINDFVSVAPGTVEEIPFQ